MLWVFPGESLMRLQPRLAMGAKRRPVASNVSGWAASESGGGGRFETQMRSLVAWRDVLNEGFWGAFFGPLTGRLSQNS